MVGKNDKVFNIGVDAEAHDGVVASRETVLLGVVSEGGLISVVSVRDDDARRPQSPPQNIDLGRRADGPQTMKYFGTIREARVRRSVGEGIELGTE